MKITFLGAAHEVTGSCTLVECGGVALHRGLRHGAGAGHVRQPAPARIAPGEVDFALLTHAHIDHSGLLPLLAKNGFSGRGVRHGRHLLAGGHYAARQRRTSR